MCVSLYVANEARGRDTGYRAGWREETSAIKSNGNKQSECGEMRAAADTGSSVQHKLMCAERAWRGE